MILVICSFSNTVAVLLFVHEKVLFVSLEFSLQNLSEMFIYLWFIECALNCNIFSLKSMYLLRPISYSLLIILVLQASFIV